jgi:hypothetical protein
MNKDNEYSLKNKFEKIQNKINLEKSKSGINKEMLLDHYKSIVLIKQNPKVSKVSLLPDFQIPSFQKTTCLRIMSLLYSIKLKIYSIR